MALFRVVAISDAVDELIAGQRAVHEHRRLPRQVDNRRILLHETQPQPSRSTRHCLRHKHQSLHAIICLSMLSAAAPVALGLNMEQEIFMDDYITDLLQHLVVKEF